MTSQSCGLPDKALCHAENRFLGLCTNQVVGVQGKLGAIHRAASPIRQDGADRDREWLIRHSLG